MSERLEDAISVIRNMVKIFHEQQGIGFQLSEHAEYVIQQAERFEVLSEQHDLALKRVGDTLKRNKELEHASKYNGELNEFLQKRKLPPNTLGRHVVDVVMDYVEELEKSNKTIKSQTGHNFEVNRKLDAENQRYRQALEFYAEENNYIHDEWKPLNPNAKSIKMSQVEFDDGEKARQALKGESK